MSGRLQLYDKTQIEKNNLLFDNKALAALLFPLIIEQLLNSFMGMADTMMVSNVGSAAISAVSLVGVFGTCYRSCNNMFAVYRKQEY